MNSVRLIEAPRELWQALNPVPVALKAEYLRALVNAEFRRIDALSFVSEHALPQMADHDALLELLESPGFDPRTDDSVEMMALVATHDGAERALATGAVDTLVFPYSISPTFLERNQRQTPEDALEELEQIGELAYKQGAEVMALVDMAFGNPYGDEWDVDEVVSAVDLLADAGIDQVSLADTAGAASPDLLENVLRLVLDVHAAIEISVSLHMEGAPAEAAVKAVWNAGCREFRSVVGGGGGSPLAGQLLPGLIATETLCAQLRALGAELPQMGSLDSLSRISRELARRFAPVVQ